MKEIVPHTDLMARMIIILMMADIAVNNDMNISNSIILDFENTNISIALSINPMIFFDLFKILEVRKLNFY